ncbi:MAG: transposase [Dysgonamonadaceae bacterium]|nr:transposase [Dysgonamonadaceae bacterium]
MKNDLILFDRGYPSKDFIAYLEGSKIKYLMRMKKKPMKEVNEAKRTDQVIEMNVKGKTISACILRLVLDSGEEEVLITNLLDENLSMEEFKVLYFKRWGTGVSS